MQRFLPAVYGATGSPFRLSVLSFFAMIFLAGSAFAYSAPLCPFAVNHQATATDYHQAVKDVLTKYNPAKLSAREASNVTRAFADKGLQPGPELRSAIRSAGFDPDLFLPPPGFCRGKTPPVQSHDAKKASFTRPCKEDQSASIECRQMRCGGCAGPAHSNQSASIPPACKCHAPDRFDAGHTHQHRQ